MLNEGMSDIPKWPTVTFMADQFLMTAVLAIMKLQLQEDSRNDHLY